MEAVFLIILLVVLAGVVWWRINAKKSAAARETSTGSAVGQPERPRPEGGLRTDGALSGGSAAASAEAAGTTGIPSAAGFGRPAEPAAPVTADEPAETASATARDVPAAAAQHGGAGSSAVGASHVSDGEARTAAGANSGEAREERRIKDEAEWETQWSEASGPAPAHEGAGHRESATTAAHAPASETSGTELSGTTDKGTVNQHPVHHAEYTAPQAPTLPGAETAAVEEPEDARTAAAAPQPSAARAGSPETGNTAPSPGGAGAGVGLPSDAAAVETQDRAQSSALVETGADHTQDQPAAMPSAGTAPAATPPAGTESAGHLAAEEPYGAGSASAAADGSGPADYTVKGDAGAMVYYEEGHPEYEQTRADVWFESPAHAEAAGFRAPRRRRI
ncbi:putative uncharacterized protein [Pseudarthrobacter siccitolerans]|uniref:Membrane protein ArfC n=1 Tax=Pseudarthrobacter siccitolerans TaxID=861266 RepID=A0A024H1E6_9MICC|nr:hypothetical protein [Pseudarthrobacter siccitolerans]CCQ45707.1 putative uncharacterized protein [Pseudarthrobacter siccitolerans]